MNPQMNTLQSNNNYYQQMNLNNRFIQPEPMIQYEEVPIELILKGINGYDIVVNGIPQKINIRPGEQEGKEYPFENVNVKLKYKQNSHYKREGNDLIGTFTYERQHAGKQITIPHPIDNQIGAIQLQEGQFIFYGKGFRDINNPCLDGNYRVTIKLQ